MKDARSSPVRFPGPGSIQPFTLTAGTVGDQVKGRRHKQDSEGKKSSSRQANKAKKALPERVPQS